VQNNRKTSLSRKPAATIQVKASLFLLAARSYPERFCHQPAVSFEQHFLSLLAASNAVRPGR